MEMTHASFERYFTTIDRAIKKGNDLDFWKNEKKVWTAHYDEWVKNK